MEIKRFALGMRFDFLKEHYSEEDVSFILNEIAAVLSVKDVVGLNIFGGLAKLGDDDSEGVFTVVFTGGGMKFTRNVYRKLNGDAILRSFADRRVPFVQNNVIRSFDGLEFFGTVAEDGSLAGGSGRKLAFACGLMQRKAFSEEGSVILAPGTMGGKYSCEEAVRVSLSAARKRFPGTNFITVPVYEKGGSIIGSIKAAAFVRRRVMEVTSDDGAKVKAEYLAFEDGKTAVIEAPNTERTSAGTGEMILRAAQEGLKKIYVFIGESVPNDFGFGMARTLGVKFLKDDGSDAAPGEIFTVDTSGIDPLVRSAELTVVCGGSEAAGGFEPEKLSKLKPAQAMRSVLTGLFGAKAETVERASANIAGIDERLKRASLLITSGSYKEEAKRAGVKIEIL